MDDGYWPLSILMLLGFILVDALLYGFGAALQNMNQNNLEKAAEEGSERAGRLLALVERPAEFINTVQVMTNLIGLVTGAYLLKQFGQLFFRLAGMAETGQERVFYAVSLVLAAVLLTVLCCAEKRCFCSMAS